MLMAEAAMPAAIDQSGWYKFGKKVPLEDELEDILIFCLMLLRRVMVTVSAYTEKTNILIGVFSQW
jgi:hypothetical protein